jgi:hypothetical protein
VAIQGGDREVWLLEHVAEVVDEHLVVRRERPPQRPEVRVGVDGDDAVAPHARQQRAEQHRQRRLPHTALRRDDRDRRAAHEARRGDRPVQPRLILRLAPGRAHALARRPLLGPGEQLAFALGRRLGGLVDRRLLLIAGERLDRRADALAAAQLDRERDLRALARRAAARRLDRAVDLGGLGRGHRGRPQLGQRQHGAVGDPALPERAVQRQRLVAGGRHRPHRRAPVLGRRVGPPSAGPFDLDGRRPWRP